MEAGRGRESQLNICNYFINILLTPLALLAPHASKPGATAPKWVGGLVGWSSTLFRVNEVSRVSNTKLPVFACSFCAFALVL